MLNEDDVVSGNMQSSSVFIKIEGAVSRQFKKWSKLLFSMSLNYVGGGCK